MKLIEKLLGLVAAANARNRREVGRLREELDYSHRRDLARITEEAFEGKQRSLLLLAMVDAAEALEAGGSAVEIARHLQDRLAREVIGRPS